MESSRYLLPGNFSSHVINANPSSVDAVDHVGHDHEFTKLVMDLKGKDPDDSFSTVPYEKVSFTLFHEAMLSNHLTMAHHMTSNIL
jgi:hypothetical protein